MAIDAQTTLVMTLVVAVVSSAFLALELRGVREPARLSWCAGFASVAAGCAIALLRTRSFVIGVWAADGLLVVAHLLFLCGAGHHAGRPVRLGWLLLLAPWLGLLAVPPGAERTVVYAAANAALVAVVALGTATTLLRSACAQPSAAGRALGLAFLLHGLFYCGKTALAFHPGSFVDLDGLRGMAITASLCEGMVFAVLFALLMAAAIRQRLEADITMLADRDPLTDILNRRGFERAAGGALRNGRHPYGLLLLDLDHFKRINDTFGHGPGDRLLVAFARHVAALLPTGAIFARVGGEEFAVLLPGSDHRAMRTLGETICSTFATAAAEFEGRPVRATVSIGGASAGAGMAIDRAREVADQALYAAKREGRNRCIAHPLTEARQSLPFRTQLAAAKLS